MRAIAVGFVVVAVLMVTGCSRNLTPASAYAADAGSAWGTSAAPVSANPPTGQQTDLGGEAPAVERLRAAGGIRICPTVLCQ